MGLRGQPATPGGQMSLQEECGSGGLFFTRPTFPRQTTSYPPARVQNLFSVHSWVSIYGSPSCMAPHRSDYGTLTVRSFHASRHTLPTPEDIKIRSLDWPAPWCIQCQAPQPHHSIIRNKPTHTTHARARAHTHIHTHTRTHSLTHQYPVPGTAAAPWP